MAEQRSEDADVVASAVAGAQDGLLVELVGRAEARRPVERVLDVAVQPDVADAGDVDLAGREIEEPAVARLR